jgi:hypothetical protein
MLERFSGPGIFLCRSPMADLCHVTGRQLYLGRYRCDMQRSIPRVILETVATAAVIVLLLYLVFGPPT